MSYQNKYDELSDQSRVWIYQSNRVFTDEEAVAIEKKIEAFIDNWISHNRKLKAFGSVYHKRFIVLMVDETTAGASGCSIDKSVYFLQQIESEYGIDLFDRMRFAYKANGSVQSVTKAAFEELYRNKVIDETTMVFDTLVDNKGDFDRNWLKPLGKSWHIRFVG